MSARAFGLRMLFGLSQVTGLGSETLYQELVNDHQGRVNTILGLDDDLPGGLATQKSEVARIWGEAQSKATKDKNFHGASEQINVELVPLLDTATPPAEDHRVNRPRYQSEFVPLQGEINATLLDWPFDGAERVDLDDANTQVTAAGGNREYTQAMTLFDNLDVPTLLSNAKPLKAKYVTDKVEYDKERLAAEQLLTDLKKHAQKAHVAGEINDAETALTDAKLDADVAHMDDARIDVATAKTACEDGKDYADEFAKYVPKRAAAQVIVYSLQGISDGLDATLVNVQNTIDDADAKVTPPDHDYVDACSDVDGVLATWRSALKRDHIDSRTQPISDLKAKVNGKPAAAFLDSDIKEIETRLALVQTHFNANAWKKLLMASNGVQGLLNTGNKTADRRILYDNQKTLTVAAVNGLKTHPPVAGRFGAMELLVTAADDLASRENMQIEDGIAALKKIADQCAELVKSSDEAKEYAKERKAADTRFTNLGTHAAAANLTEPLATIKAELEAAEKLAEPLNDKSEAVVSGKKEQDFPGARKIIAQAVKDLIAAEALAASLSEASASQTAAGSAGNKGDIEAAITELKRQIAAIPTADADLVADELGQIGELLEEATRLAGIDQVEAAKIPLQDAADGLVPVKIGLAQHARILAEHKEIDDKLQPLLKGTEPKPADIKGKTDPVATALAEALKQDEAGEWEKALAELRNATVAFTAADEAAKLRKKFDTDKAALENLRTALIDPLKGEVLTTLNEATAEAVKFAFPAAEKKLGKAEAQIDSARVSALATTDPTHTDFADLVNKMLKAEGGDKLLDALVQSIPKSPKTIEAIVALAKIRFGVEMATDAGSKKKSVKKLWEMMSKVPQDTVKNPSLKKVERRDPAEDGGYYSGTEDLVVMNGRPGQETQKFGANLVPKELPTGMLDIYKPTDDAALDYFDFSTLHEVGHAVDDRLRFMEQRLGKGQFGDWAEHGSNIDPIVTAVGKKTKYNTTAEQTAYIHDLILGLKPTPPTPPSGKEVEWNAAQQKVDRWHYVATFSGIWDLQTYSAEIELDDGRVYHEAYKNNWVSYPLAERAKGLTGYQFRAPGEWFAELYAGFYAGKLKKGHPAEAWLTKLNAKP